MLIKSLNGTPSFILRNTTMKASMKISSVIAAPVRCKERSAGLMLKVWVGNIAIESGGERRARS